MKTNKIRLTDKEKEIIHHRLEIPKVIYECFSGSSGIDYTEEEFDRAYLELKNNLRISYLDLSKLSGCAIDILIECLEGSTYLACMHGTGEFSQREISIATSTAELLEDKLSKAGITVEIPKH